MATCSVFVQLDVVVELTGVTRCMFREMRFEHRVRHVHDGAEEIGNGHV
jgi:hypothetical protein